MPAKGNISFGIMCTTSHLQAWEAACIEELMADPRIQLKLLIFDSPHNYGGSSLFNKLRKQNPNQLLFNLWSRFLLRPRSRRPVDCSTHFKDVESITCQVSYKGKFSQHFSDADLGKIRSYNLDFILRFGFNIVRGGILEAARYGIWSFHHDDEQKYRGAPPCFWEIYRGDPCTGSILQRLTNKLDGGVVLRKGWFRTQNYSYSKNIDQAYFESSRWPYQVARQLMDDDTNFTSLVSQTKAPIYYPPTNAQLLYFFLLLTKNAARKTFQRLFQKDQWTIGLIEQPIEKIVESGRLEKPRLSVPVPSDRFYADVMGFKQDGRLQLLFEELEYKKKFGYISCITIDDQYKIINKRKVFDTSSHLSYPFLFTDNQRIYCMPESSAMNRLELWKAESLPDTWIKVTVLLEGMSVVDATLFKHEGKYWLFYTRRDNDFDPDLHLFIAWSDNITGPFHSHPRNPVKTSARSARPAGTMFNYKENIYRPAQNFTKTYGGSIILNKIIILTTEQFEEVETCELFSPEPRYPAGLHTLCVIDEKTVVVDYKRKKRGFIRP